MKHKYPNCPKCPSSKFDIGNIRIGNEKTADVVYCLRCKAVISIFEHSLKDAPVVTDTPVEKPIKKGSSSSVGEALTKWG